MKIIGMIPARLTSKRVRKKNIRLINNKPLIQYIIDSAKESKLLNKIYINSENLIFKEIANKNNIEFYQRPRRLSSDTATNDDFVVDFLDKINCDYLIQLLPTSPFITTKQIDRFINVMLNKKYDTMISVSKIQIETIYNNKPVNFDPKKQTPPSQLLKPLYPYACGIMGWKSIKYMKNINKYKAAYHGGKDKVGFFELDGFAKIDVDNEEDFRLAEAVASSYNNNKIKPKYYSPNLKYIFDAQVKKILKMDGVIDNNQEEFNKEVSSIKKIIKNKSKKESWSHTLINTSCNSATLIGQMPGEGNRLHFHPNWDEWWYIIQGIWEWDIEGKKKLIKEGDIVFIKRNRKHRITAVGKKLAIRLAVSRYDVDHVYLESNYSH